MKVIATGSIRFGTRRFEEGEEIEVPDRLGNALIAGGKASAAGEKPAKKKAKAEEPPAENGKKTYKTRKIEAEDSD